VKYVIEMLKDGANMSSILTAIKQHNDKFAGYDMDTNSVSVSSKYMSHLDIILFT